MKMVAAAKLRRAQTRLVQARPYAAKMNELLNNVVGLIEGEPHFLFQKKEEVKTAEFLVFTTDRGLCGGFNGNLLRRIEIFLKEKSVTCPNIVINTVGKKGRDFFNSHHRELKDILTGVPEIYPFEEALKMAEGLIEGYQAGRFDEFYIVYNFFRSAISQEIRIEKILPFEKLEKAAVPQETYIPEYLYEPSRQSVLEKLIPRTLALLIRRAFLETVAGEYGARMVAMDNATSNCVDMNYRLTLQMNRIRQAAITKELMDIVNGAESQKKQ